MKAAAAMAAEAAASAEAGASAAAAEAAEATDFKELRSIEYSGASSGRDEAPFCPAESRPALPKNGKKGIKI